MRGIKRPVYDTSDPSNSEHYLSKLKPRSPEWIIEYERLTEKKYKWYLPLRPYTWNEYRIYVDDFVMKTCETFYYEGFLKGLYSHFIVMYLFCFIIVWIVVIWVAAVLTLDERKLIATIQNRHGPARVGYGGYLQPISDAFKMILKEFIEPRYVKDLVFRHSAFLSFFFASFFWMALPYNGEFTIINTHFTFLFIILISLLHAYAILTAGWSSNSKYSFLGGVRTVCQLISYDIVVIFIFLNLYIHTRSMDLDLLIKDQTDKGFFLKFSLGLGFTFLIAFLAESNRHPYDLPEAEAELVSGYNVEYSSIKFAMFFLAEYASTVYTSILFMLIFLNPNEILISDYLAESIRVLISCYLTVWARSLLPRYRYDQLMRSCWKSHIPISCAAFFLNFILYVYL